MKKFLFLAVLLIFAQFSFANADDNKLFQFENGNEARWFSKNNREVAIYDKSGKMISKKFMNHKILTKSFGNRFTLSSYKPDLIVFTLLAPTTLLIIDQNGKETSLKLKDSFFTDVVELNENEILLTGTKGNLYQINLPKAELTETFNVSKDTISIIKTLNKKMLIRDGLLSFNKIHVINTLDETIKLTSMISSISLFSQMKGR